MMETKFLATNDAAIAVDERKVSGLASVFGGIDSYNDTVIKGAYAGAIKEAGSKGIPMLYQHNPDIVIGRWVKMEETDQGLIVEGHLTPGHSVANDVYASLKAGHMDGMSIGYRVPPGGASKRADGVRMLTTIDLKEISIVTFPADTSARVAGIKAAEQTEREFERLLLQVMRDAGVDFSRSEAIALMRDGFKGLSAKRDAGGRYEPATLRDLAISAIRQVRGN